MAYYPRSRRRTGRSAPRRASRSYGRRQYGRPKRRVSSRRRTTAGSAGARTLKIVIEHAGANTVARPETVSPTRAAPPRRAKF